MPSNDHIPMPVGSRPILWIILISFSMLVVDNSIVFTGLSKIQSELGFTDVGLSWITSLYALTFGGFLLLGARAGDVFGRNFVFTAGLAVFSLSSAAIAFAPSPAVLVIARAIQGMGAAIVAPSTLSLLQAEFPAGELRARVLSYYAAAGGVSASIGLVIGGIFAGLLSWRVGFFINVPIGLLLIWALRRYGQSDEVSPGRIDGLGAATSTIAIGALLLGIERAATVGWSDPWTIPLLVASAVLFVAFVVVEMRVAVPLIPLRLFASSERSAAYVARALFLGANIGFYFFISQYMQGVLGMSAAMAGLAFLPSTVVNFAAAMLEARLMRRFGSATSMMFTIGCGLIGILLLSFVTPSSGYWTALFLPMMLVGIGQGGTLAPLTSSGIAGVERHDAGAASGFLNVSQQVGTSLGIAIITAYAATANVNLGGSELLADRVRLALQASSAMMILTLLIVGVFIFSRKRSEAA
ncbi:EmrB/QacA subfamily drug resistance transporter [Rhizobium sp. PP-CC-2G-626]|nr:EmrB/QacA subfamily drug resistance transporter [Rhizobium sp. PP-CC-2G-626]